MFSKSIVSVALVLMASPVLALECVSKEGVQLSWNTRAKDSKQFVASVNWGTWGVEQMDCARLSTSGGGKTYECQSEFEWNVFEVEAVVTMADDQKSAIVRSVASDRRFSAGYRIDKTYNLVCK